MASANDETNPDQNNNNEPRPPPPPPARPLFSLGLVADIQYADMADSHVEGRTQRFRECPAKLDAALAAMRREARRRTRKRSLTAATTGDGGDASEGGTLDAVLALGDIINGNREDASLTPSDLETVASIIDRHFPPPPSASGKGKEEEDDDDEAIPVYHVLGNHCLDVPKRHVTERLRFPPSALLDDVEGEDADPSAAPPPPACYSVPLHRGWRLVALDTTEMSGHAQDAPGSARALEAAAYLAGRPLTEGVDSADPQMSPWNGGPGSKQVEWLRKELAGASARGERCVVAGHHQVGPGEAVRRTHAAWNWREVAEVVTGGRVVDGVEVVGEEGENATSSSSSSSSSPSPSPSPAVLYLAGHDHEGGYSKAGGVHFLTLEAIVEAPTGSNAFAVLDFYDDRIVVRGFGSATSRCLEL